MERAAEDVVRRARGIDGDKDVLPRIKVSQRRRAALVSIEAHTNRLGPVVLTLNERAAAVFAGVRRPGRASGDVEDGPAVGTSSAAGEAVNDLVARQAVIQDSVDPDFFASENFLECGRLRDGPRETVEQKSAGTVQAADALSKHVEDDVVGHELAPTHVAKRLLHRGRQLAAAILLGGTENVAGREMAGAEVRREPLGLRAFADAGGPLARLFGWDWWKRKA
jgi:hypothetical protein